MLLWLFTIFIVFSASLSSCTFPAISTPFPKITITSPPSPTRLIPLTSTSTSTITSAPIPTITAQPDNTLTPTVFSPVNLNAKVAVEILNIRQGPGTTFDIVVKLKESTTLTVTGRAPGDEWGYIETVDSQSGWASLSFLQVDGEIDNLKLEDLASVYQIKGKVNDAEGNPISDITVAVYQTDGAINSRTDAVTTTDGEFFAYLPIEENPIHWQISVVGIGCKSRIADETCGFSGSFEPVAVIISPPVQNEVIFTYFP